MEDMVKKAMKVFLTRMGYEILDEDYEGFIMTSCDNMLVAVLPIISHEDLDEEPHVDKDVRSKFEHAVYSWALNQENVSPCQISMDILDFHIIREDRGLIRHIVNAHFTE